MSALQATGGGDEAGAWSGEPVVIMHCKQLEVLSGRARVFAKRKTVRRAGSKGQKKQGWSLMRHKTKKALLMGRRFSASKG